MLLNNYTSNKIDFNLPLNEESYIIQDIISMINRPIENKAALMEYIDSKIAYFDKYQILIRDMSRINRQNFNTVINSAKRAIRTKGIGNRVYNIKVPNKSFSQIPNYIKVPNPYVLKRKWDIKIADNIAFTDSNSFIYNKLVKDITYDRIKKVSGIMTFDFYKNKECVSEKDILDAINTIVYPGDDIDFIINYMDAVKNFLLDMKKIDIDVLKGTYKYKLYTAARQINNQTTMFRYTINVLLSIYTRKCSIIQEGLSYQVAKNTIDENVSYDKIWEEAKVYINEGFNIDDMINKSYGSVEMNVYNIRNYISDMATQLYNEKINKYNDIKDNNTYPIFTFNKYDKEKISKPSEEILSLYPSYTKYIEQNKKISNNSIPTAFTDKEVDDKDIDDILEIISKDYEELEFALKDLQFDLDENVNITNSYCELFQRNYSKLALYINNEQSLISKNDEYTDRYNLNESVMNKYSDTLLDSNIDNYNVDMNIKNLVEHAICLAMIFVDKYSNI